MSTHRAGRSALDEFLPEPALPADVQRARGETRSDMHLPPSEVQIDPIENFPSPVVLKPSSVQMWPMVAAAMVAIGVALLALAGFAKFFHTTV